MRPVFSWGVWSGCLVLTSMLALPVSVGFAQPAENPPARPPITTRQTSFSIPFRVEGNPSGAQSSVEVQLHCSEDQGLTWRLWERVPPTTGRFNFRAPHDGEYWFMVRTLDKEGHVRPEGPPAPELRVLIDTLPPQLELHASRGPAGEIRVRWRVSDPHLRPDTFAVSYQIAGSNNSWQTVAVDRPEAQGPDGTALGEAGWWPENTTAAILVRAQVSDTAGNRNSSQTTIPAAAAPGADQSAALRAPLTEMPVAPAASTPISTAPVPKIPVPSQRQTTAWQAEETSVKSLATPASAPPQMPSTFPGAASTAAQSLQAAPVSPAYARQTTITPPPSVDAVADLQRSMEAASRNPATKPAEVADATSVRRVEAAPLAASAGKDQEASALQGDALPPGIRPRMVNVRRFDLEYDVEAVGPDGVGKVELWGTRDGGKTWTSFGTDEDSRSPFRVSVEGQGLYGFRMIIESSTGLRGSAPKSGDLPDVWVGVDTSKPVAKLTIPEQNRPGELRLEWEATDQLLAARPIALSFAESANGPWSTIASGLENTGRYDWRLDNRVPDRIFLRLEVRDEAGNIQSVATAEPIEIDRIRPQGRILSVRPVGDSARVPNTGGGLK
jgi:hypothetical protein